MAPLSNSNKILQSRWHVIFPHPEWGWGCGERPVFISLYTIDAFGFSFGTHRALAWGRLWLMAGSLDSNFWCTTPWCSASRCWESNPGLHMQNSVLAPFHSSSCPCFTGVSMPWLCFMSYLGCSSCFSKIMSKQDNLVENDIDSLFLLNFNSCWGHPSSSWEDWGHSCYSLANLMKSRLR